MTCWASLLFASAILLIAHQTPCHAREPAESIAATAQDEANAELAWLDGTWIGTGCQRTGTAKAFSIKAVLNTKKGTYKAQYSSLPCTGSWSILASDGCQVKFSETIESGDCDPGTVIVTQLVLIGNQSRYITWTLYAADGTLKAWATLKRS
ncbi:MAG: hypothetical protein AB1714_09955 [Acidobacteriota bacterium]